MAGLRVLIVDNYDSFVYNLYQYVGELGCDPVVVRHDQVAGLLETGRFDRLIISPGPGRPEESTGGELALEEMGATVPTLGVCLGHQLIGYHFGAKVVRATQVMHGRSSVITHDGRGIYSGLPERLPVARYHSLVIDPSTVPDELVVTSSTEDGVIMGVRHRDLPIEGVQFHPESILTGEGHRMIENFLG